MGLIENRQTTPYGCGMYAVANTLYLNEFVTEERLNSSKNGNNIGQLSKWLQEDGYNIYIDVFYYNRFETNAPEDFFSLVPINNDITISTKLLVLLEVKLSENSLSHLIGCEVDEFGKCIIFDSLKEESFECEFKEILDYYHTCFGIYHFSNIETSEMIVHEYAI